MLLATRKDWRYHK